MRLLKTGPFVPGDEKLEVCQQWGKTVPPYAILSHTWSNNPMHEVLLSDVQNGTCASKPAYAKLIKAMERARLDGYGWLWIDSCCIDQTSNVELSEAINSMYNYYKNSEKCYAYLSDVEDGTHEDQFKKARWWGRGWTLQELLAPSRLEFFNVGWNSLGYKDSLHEIIEAITGIDHDYLTGRVPMEQASIAKRMSWAASRETKREEDVAYSLIGIFDVNMAMLYGEGAVRAFLRLQEEILKSSEDQSLFAWVKDGGGKGTENSQHGLFADSPRDFKRTGHMISYTEMGTYKHSAMTARGLNITLPITPKGDGSFIAALHCPVPERGYNDWLAVYLKQLRTGTDQYARVDCSKLASVSELGFAQQIYIRQHQPRSAVQSIYPSHFFQLRSLRCSGNDEELNKYTVVKSIFVKPRSTGLAPVAPPKAWCGAPLVYEVDKTAGSLSVALLVKRHCDQETFIVMLGTSSKFAAAVAVCEGLALDSFANLQEFFFPQAPGEFMSLEYHSVRVSVQDMDFGDKLVHHVDLEIIPYPKPPTAAELINDAFDIFTAPNRVAAKEDFRFKMKRMWTK